MPRRHFGPDNPIILGPFLSETIADAKARVSWFLHRHDPPTSEPASEFEFPEGFDAQLEASSSRRVTEYVRPVIANPNAVTDPEEVAVLHDLIKMHPSAEDKIGCGIDRFEVRANRGEGWNNVGYWIVRVDGSETDFSYLACFSPTTHETAVSRALRQEVADQINAFRSTAYATDAAPLCGICNRPTPAADCHMPDKYKPIQNPKPPGSKRMKAKFMGDCAKCGKIIEPGSMQFYQPSTKGVWHIICPDPAGFVE